MEEVAGVRVVIAQNSKPVVEYLVKWKVRTPAFFSMALRTVLATPVLLLVCLQVLSRLRWLAQDAEEQTWCAHCTAQPSWLSVALELAFMLSSHPLFCLLQ